jgi:hypothetical protein
MFPRDSFRGGETVVMRAENQQFVEEFTLKTEMIYAIDTARNGTATHITIASSTCASLYQKPAFLSTSLLSRHRYRNALNISIQYCVLRKVTEKVPQRE